MHRILLIAKRDYLASVKSKAFLFGLIVAPDPLRRRLHRPRPHARQARPRRPPRSHRRPHRRRRPHDHRCRRREKRPRPVRQDHRQTDRAALRLRNAVPPDDHDPNAQLLALSDRVRKRELFAFIDIGANALHLASDPGSGKELAARKSHLLLLQCRRHRRNPHVALRPHHRRSPPREARPSRRGPVAVRGHLPRAPPSKP